MSPEVSVIIPIHNEEGILVASVEELCAGLDALGEDYEVILAENGSRDRTAALAAELAAARPRVRTLSIGAPNYGGALREGLRVARGRLVLCEEIDLCDLDFHRRALALLRGEGPAPGERRSALVPDRVPDLVIGSKAMRGAHDRRPLLRRLATRGYNGLLRVTLGFRGTDTHGLKALRREVLAPIADACIVDYDVFASELVIRAQRAGVATREIPVDLAEKRPPSVHLLRRVPKVLRLLLRLWASIHLGRDLGGRARPAATSAGPQEGG
ncbi:MAG: glycosyltransferase [Myxococcales bacterium]|nr:glycosyltransferase [Myxococcales bacterium]